MAPMFSMRPIGFVRCAYLDTSQIPRGFGASHNAEGILEIAEDLETGLLDIEGFSHLFVVWVFDRSKSIELVGTPPTDDRPHGVFATRSPYRPNPIGLTVVQLLARERNRLHVRGIDMLDATPILDVKPYLSGVPPEKIRRGWMEDAEKRAKDRRAGR
jgi:tRNA-Thr(GGU) m(6)t(6)A37 methyltransferase TsaA